MNTAMTNCSTQGIGESTIIGLTFPHGLLEYTSSQFPSAPLFSLPAGYRHPSPDVIFKKPQTVRETTVLQHCHTKQVLQRTWRAWDFPLKLGREGELRQQISSLWYTGVGHNNRSTIMQQAHNMPPLCACFCYDCIIYGSLSQEFYITL